MDTLKKNECFKGEKIIVLPGNFLSEASQNPLIRPVYPTDIGFFPDAQYHYRVRPTGSDQNILIYCINGEGFALIHGKKRPIKSDTLLIIPKGIPHSYGSNEEKPWTIYWTHFLGTNAGSYLNSINEEHCTISVPIEKKLKVKLLFDEIIDTLEKGYTLDSMIYISQVLANLLGVFFFMNNDHKLGLKEDHIRIEESIHFMVGHLGSSLTLKQLAQQANLSVPHYSFLFKKKTGFTPIDYFIRLKIQSACKYLDTVNLTVSEIAKGLGFQDPYYFSRAFRKIMQQSPSSYREIKKG